MASRLTLTLPPGFGSNEDEVEVDAKRFSIGRTPENDLVLNDTSLSRRHALIENFDGVFNLSDCGSSNGTYINGRPLTGLAELRDWDVLTFGRVGDIVVRLQDDAQLAQAVSQTPARSASSAKGPASASARQVVQRPGSTGAVDQFWFSAPVIATAAAFIILIITGLILLATRNSNSRGGSKPAIAKKQEPVVDHDNDDKRASVATPNEGISDPKTDDAGSSNPGETGSVELSTIEAYASNVLSGISKDTHLVLTAKPLSEIEARIQRYRDAPTSLRDELREMKRAIPQVSAAAKSNGVRTPLAVYATLARIDKDGGGGDPVRVAGQLCPALAKMRVIFGDELANDALLSVAALEEGASLQARITKLSGRVNDSPTTIRSIWYLHDHQVISAETYNFVLRFMAIGVIAQNPQKFGIAAEPLTF